MKRKVSPADRYRKELLEAVADASLDFSGYCRLAAQTMLQSAMEIEVGEFVGRASYQRRDAGQSTYRNGYKCRRVATGEGAVELHVPQTRAGGEPFQTAILDAYRRRSETLDAMIPTASHRRRVRTSNTLERLIEEARRRTKVIGPMVGEQSDLLMIYAVLMDVSKRWRGIKLTPGDLEKLNALRSEVVPLAATG